MEEQVRKDTMYEEGRTWVKQMSFGMTGIDGEACLRQKKTSTMESL
jgi:hypothetical protein